MHVTVGRGILCLILWHVVMPPIARGQTWLFQLLPVSTVSNTGRNQSDSGYRGPDEEKYRGKPNPTQRIANQHVRLSLPLPLALSLALSPSISYNLSRIRSTVSSSTIIIALYIITVHCKGTDRWYIIIYSADVYTTRQSEQAHTSIDVAIMLASH